jgi:hypothetical protein
MRFPSIAALTERARVVLLRFPWVMACGAAAAVAAIIAIDRQNDDFWIRLCLVAALGIPLTLSLTLLAERQGWTGVKKTGLLATGILALIWFLITWPGPEQKHLLIRYLQLSVAVHLLVSFLPFWRIPERSGFWQFNRRLFEGFLRAVLFSGVLFVGLSIALGALDKLFGVDVPSKTYFRLWLLLAFAVNTWIFLAAVPDDLEMRGEEENYPRALKLFTQYVLTPLVAIYLLILTAYLVKILVTGSWPSGWIGYLVSSVATAGILGFLLVHPLHARESEGWIRTYSRWLFIGLIPAAVMFLLALWKRMDPYGITELRFLGILLGAWLLGIALWYTVRRDSGIRIIPVSLATILLLTAFGPLSTTGISIRSQAGRLRSMLSARATASLSDGDQREISEALRFLLERNAVTAVRDVFGENAGRIDPLPPDRHDLVDSTASRILAAAGIEYRPRYYGGVPADYFLVEPESAGAALPIAGYEYVVHLAGADSASISIESDTLIVMYDSAAMAVGVRQGEKMLLLFPLSGLADTLLALQPSARAQVPLTVVQESDSLKGMLSLASLSGEKKNGKVRVTAWRGDLYVAKHPAGGSTITRRSS